MRRLVHSAVQRAFGRAVKAKPVRKPVKSQEKVSQADLDVLLQGSGIDQLVDGRSEQPRQTGTRLLDLLDRVDEKQCRGCGAKFQFDDKNREGFIELSRVKTDAGEVEVQTVLQKLLLNNSRPAKPADELEAASEPDEAEQKQYSVEDYENDPLTLESVEQVERLFEEKVVKKELCDRCVFINEGNFERLKDIQVNIESRPCSPQRSLWTTSSSTSSSASKKAPSSWSSSTRPT